MGIEEKGLNLVLDFISEEEEKILAEKVQKTPKRKTTSRNSIQRFGSSAPYRSNIISTEIPQHFDYLLDRLVEKNLLLVRPDSVSVNEYQAGQVITPHIDSKSSGPVVSVLSLLSEATMVLSRKGHQSEKVLLPPRSLVQISGEIRNIWKHSIEPVKSLRYSVVFRCSILQRI